MATTYATLAEFKARIAETTSASDTRLQQTLDSAAVLIDAATRGYRRGAEAFSASSSAARLFDDPLDGWVEIDDLLTVSAITRNGEAIPSPAYLLYNADGNSYSAPAYTRLYLRADAPGAYSALALGSYYGYPERGQGLAAISITGTWGYCANDSTRPAAVKEATLAQALWQYKREAVTPALLAQALNTGRVMREALDELAAALCAPLERAGVGQDKITVVVA